MSDRDRRLTVTREKRIVVSSKNHKRTVVVCEKKSGLVVLFQNGMKATVDKHGTVTTRTPMLSEVF